MATGMTEALSTGIRLREDAYTMEERVGPDLEDVRGKVWLG